MLYETLSQGSEFAAMAGAGVLMGLIALIFAAARRLTRAGIAGAAILDILMGGCWALIACVSLTLACRGRARAYHFAAMAAGAYLLMAVSVAPLKRVWRFVGRLSAAFALKITASPVGIWLFK